MTVTPWRGPQRWRGVQTWRGFLADLVGGAPEQGALTWAASGSATSTYAGTTRVEIRSVAAQVPSLVGLSAPQLVAITSAQVASVRGAGTAVLTVTCRAPASPGVTSVSPTTSSLASSGSTAARAKAVQPNQPRVGNA